MWEEHALPLAAAVLRRRRRQHPARRAGHPRPQPGVAADADRDCVPGARLDTPYYPRQHLHRLPARAQPGGHRGGLPRREYLGRLERQDEVPRGPADEDAFGQEHRWRRKAAHLHRACHPGESADPVAGRGDFGARQGHGEHGAGGAREPDEGPDHARHCAPPQHDLQGRQDPGDGGRAGGRGRQPRGAAAKNDVRRQLRVRPSLARAGRRGASAGGAGAGRRGRRG
mmetsp:Transcript_100911/g.308530  ORF Transcript_100911/g.308530 Transcript_100911/m.308530 type:complete len:227 (+) Transcript_100911:1762-2442(+)